MRFETDKDLSREHKAITTFVKMFNGSFKKLDPNDIDYRVYDKEGTLVSFDINFPISAPPMTKPETPSLFNLLTSIFKSFAASLLSWLSKSI